MTPETNHSSCIIPQQSVEGAFRPESEAECSFILWCHCLTLRKIVILWFPLARLHQATSYSTLRYAGALWICQDRYYSAACRLIGSVLRRIPLSTNWAFRAGRLWLDRRAI
jgi:hypothetical protein